MNFRRWLGRLRGGRLVPDERRWVMLDVETSGLDPGRSELLAIAAIALRVDWGKRKLVIDLADSFEVVLRQATASSRDNILLHGIGAQKQREGLEPALAMQAFVEFAGRSPLLAFHAAFDQALISRFATAHLGSDLSNPWVDIEHLCAVTQPEVRARALDDWMDHFGISCAVRHQAVSDALAQCEVLQRIWAGVAGECACWKDVVRLAARQRWIPRA